jgi:hypothetical protein
VTTEFVTTKFVTTKFATTNGQDYCRMRAIRRAGFLKQQLGDPTAKPSLRDVTTNAMICENYL